MRTGIAAFFTGVIFSLLCFVALQQVVIRTTADDLEYRFSSYVFSDTTFPWSYLDHGRVVTRFLFPVRIKVAYYDAQYHEVTSAEKPGRYGAVVRIGLNGGVDEYRYFTLYRTPEKIYWGDGPGKVPAAMLPPGTGVDPVVERNQQAQIGEMVKNGFFEGDNALLAVLLAGLAETSPQDPPEPNARNPICRDAAWWYGLRKQLGVETHYHYLADLPDGYDADPAKKWPLIFYTHSNAGAGSDMSLVRDFELPAQIKNGLRLPAIVIAPQCPRGEYWSSYALFDLLDELSAKYRIDPDRIYLAGSSGGGDTTVGLASLHPERFAALVVVAGEGDFGDLSKLKDLPFWAFQGQNDEVVQPGNVAALVEAIRQAGGTKVHFTEVPGVGHNAWDKAFANKALWQWLLAQKRGQPEAITPGVP